MIDNNQTSQPPLANIPELEQFIDRLIEEKNYPQLNEEVLTQIKDDLRDRLNDFINAKLINRLNDEKAKELDSLLDQDISPQDLNKFFKENITNFTEAMATELLNFRRVYLGLK